MSKCLISMLCIVIACWIKIRQGMRESGVSESQMKDCHCWKQNIREEFTPERTFVLCLERGSWCTGSGYNTAGQKIWRRWWVRCCRAVHASPYFVLENEYMPHTCQEYALLLSCAQSHAINTCKEHALLLSYSQSHAIHTCQEHALLRSCSQPLAVPACQAVLYHGALSSCFQFLGCMPQNVFDHFFGVRNSIKRQKTLQASKLACHAVGLYSTVLCP